MKSLIRPLTTQCLVSEAGSNLKPDVLLDLKWINMLALCWTVTPRYVTVNHSLSWCCVYRLWNVKPQGGWMLQSTVDMLTCANILLSVLVHTQYTPYLLNHAIKYQRLFFLCERRWYKDKRCFVPHLETCCFTPAVPRQVDTNTTNTVLPLAVLASSVGYSDVLCFSSNEVI